MDICGHSRSAKIIQDSYQVLPNSNSCLGEPGLKFFGFTCTALTLLVRTRLSGKPGVFCSSKGRKCENTLNAQNDKATHYIADINIICIYIYITVHSSYILWNHAKSYEINISLFITFARPSEKYHVCPAVSVPKQCRVSALVSASCFRSSSASRSLRWRSWSESSIVTSSSCMQCGNIQIPTATVQGTQGCLHKSCKIIIPGPFWSTMISCCLPFRFIQSCAYSVHSRDGRCLWQAFLQLVRFPDSALWFLLQVLERHKSGNATNQAKFLQKNVQIKLWTVDICGHFRSAKIIQDSYQVLPNSNSCLGEPGLKFFGFTCTALTLLVRTRLSGKPGVFCSSKGRKCDNTLNAQNDKATSYIADI